VALFHNKSAGDAYHILIIVVYSYYDQPDVFVGSHTKIDPKPNAAVLGYELCKCFVVERFGHRENIRALVLGGQDIVYFCSVQ